MMRFSAFLPSTRLNSLQLIDIALFLAFLPHLFILKLPMLLFLGLGVYFIYKKKSSQLLIMSFTLLGLIAIGLSFFAEYNFSSFSRLLVFISVLISFLTMAIILQRLTRSINFYLRVSPAMLMILSFFFFNSISMLFYALFTLFIFTFLLLYSRMHSSFNNILRVNGLLYLFSLPIVLLLFLSFPRISYKKAQFGFQGEEISRTGHDGKMYIDSKALLVPSPKVVMEVSFDQKVPPAYLLYFRGSTLYKDKGTEWINPVAPRPARVNISKAKSIINYKVKLYPHNRHWLYMLDLPIRQLPESFIDRDYITYATMPVKEITYYEASSALIYETQIENNLKHALDVNVSRDPKTAKALTKYINPDDNSRSKANALMKYFSSLDLSYSLKPKPMDLEHPVDSFLYDAKVGYCVHFASAFANAARLVGIPSRIVTGYKADAANAINDYLLVKEADAHAWVELYLDEAGWIRFEPTSTAKRILPIEQGGVNNAYTDESVFSRFFQQVNVYYMYTRHLINTWILQYDRSKQKSLLKELLSNTLFLLQFIGILLALIISSFFLFIMLQKAGCEDKLLCEMEVLIRFLQQRGDQRQQGENMSEFLHALAKRHKEYRGLEQISQLYHEMRYSQKEHDLAHLKAKIKAFINSVKNAR